MPADLTELVESLVSPDDLLLHSMSYPDIQISPKYWLHYLEQECPEAHEEISQCKYALYDHAMFYLHLGEGYVSPTAISILLLLGLYQAGRRCIKFLQTEIHCVFYAFHNPADSFDMGEIINRRFYEFAIALVERNGSHPQDIPVNCLENEINSGRYYCVKPVIKAFVKTDHAFLNQGIFVPLLFHIALCDPTWACALVKLPGVKLDTVSKLYPLYIQPVKGLHNLLTLLISGQAQTRCHLPVVKHLIRHVDQMHPQLKLHPTVKASLQTEPSDYKSSIGQLLFPR